MLRRFLGWIAARTIEAWDDWRDPDWKPVYDPCRDCVNNPTPRQIEKMYGVKLMTPDEINRRPCP